MTASDLELEQSLSSDITIKMMHVIIIEGRITCCSPSVSPSICLSVPRAKVIKKFKLSEIFLVDVEYATGSALSLIL